MSILEEKTERSDVIAAYRMLLGRDPESEQAIDGHHGNYSRIGALRLAFMQSSEFRATVGCVPYFLYDKWVLTEVRDNLRLWVNLRDNVVSRAALDNGWEPGITALILGNLRKGDCFIDIGANIGWFTVLAANRFRQLGGGKVYAFEPRSDIYRMASRSIAENGLGDYVELHNVALADKPGTMQLFWQKENENAAASALAPGGVPAGAAHEAVQLMRLDDVAIPGPVRLIKSDAEGAEGIVFGGASKLLDRWRPEIVAELNIAGLPAVSAMSADEWLGTMFARGYSCRLVHDDGTIGRDVKKAEETGDPAANVLFVAS